MNTNDPIPFAEELELRFQRMVALAQQRIEGLPEFLSTQPQSIECEKHPGSLRMIDEQLSVIATADNDVKQAAYQPCQLCEAEQAFKLESQRLHAQGVPRNLLHCTFENWTPKDSERSYLDAVKQFTHLRCGFLIMVGELGTGKSHLAVAVMRHFRKGLFTTQSSLLRKLRVTYNDRTSENPIEACKKVELLTVDEMGLSGGGRDELPMLHEILNHRHGEKLPTILTANIGWPELKEIIGPRLADRLRESAFKILSFNGDSHRPERRGEYFG